MKTKRLTIQEAISALTSGEEVVHRDQEGRVDYRLHSLSNGHICVYELDGEPAMETVMVITRPDLILSSRWELEQRPMTYQEACNYSSKYGVACKRLNGSAKVFVDSLGEIQVTTVTPYGSISRSINQKDVNATDWVPY